MIKEFCDIHENYKQARALGFCVSVAHAEFMAEAFNLAGIPAIAVTSQSPTGVRSQAAARLRRREINALFTVDLFNEGIDIPEADCLLFLRPTESSTVFIQQLGRGLRLDSGKTGCLVLDFIGNQHREFRFDVRFRTLFGGTRQQAIRQIKTGITRLPGNCYFRLDKESRSEILNNLKSRLQANRQRMTQELRALAKALGRRPRLLEYLQDTQYDLGDVYKPSTYGWTELLQAADLLDQTPSTAELRLCRQFQHITHVDSTERLKLFEQALIDPEFDSSGLEEKERRTILMLTFRLLQSEAREPGGVWSASIDLLKKMPSAAAELRELVEVLREKIHVHTSEQPYREDWPLYLHRRYTRDEILTAVGYQTLETRRTSREGRLQINEAGVELFFVTLDKSERQFSPTTRYEDFAVSPTRFHWQSQSTTGEDSPTGRRYSEQKAEFLLFVRPRKSEPFVFLGPLRYVSHTGSRPMSIYWDLKTPMPAWFFEQCASLRAA